MYTHEEPPLEYTDLLQPPDILSMETVLKQCDQLLDQDSVRESRVKFMKKAVSVYRQAAMLLGYFSQLLDFSLELAQLQARMTAHRGKILDTYIDILHPDATKELSMPPVHTKAYQKGIHKFHRIKNYILFHYRQKLYTELESRPLRINSIRELVDTVTRLDKHYDIYEELIGDLQKKNKTFDRIMNRHLAEFIYI